MTCSLTRAQKFFALLCDMERQVKRDSAAVGSLPLLQAHRLGMEPAPGHRRSTCAKLEPIRQNGGEPIMPSAAPVSPRSLNSVHLSYDRSRARRGREPALLGESVDA